MYKIIYSPKAIEDLQKLKRSEPAAYKKADKFIKELKEHPKTGPTSLDNNPIPFPLTGERDVSFWRYGVRCFISVTKCKGEQCGDDSLLYVHLRFSVFLITLIIVLC